MRTVGGALDRDDVVSWELLRQAELVPRAKAPNLGAQPQEEADSNIPTRGFSAVSAARLAEEPGAAGFGLSPIWSPAVSSPSWARGGGRGRGGHGASSRREPDAWLHDYSGEASPRPAQSLYKPAPERPDYHMVGGRYPDLEGSLTELMQTLYKEEQRNVLEMKQRSAREADASLARSRCGCGQAELAFWRLAAKSYVEEPAPGVVEAELSSLATKLLAAAPPPGERMRLEGFRPSQLPAHVAGILEACQRQVNSVGARDKGAKSALEVAKGLGDLLVEVERDCEAMMLALSGVDGDASRKWAARLGTVSKTLQPPFPDPESLAHQLESENELLRQALTKPVPMGTL